VDKLSGWIIGFKQTGLTFLFQNNAARCSWLNPLLAVLLLTPLTACKESRTRPDRHIKIVLEELNRIDSSSDAGLNDASFEIRVNAAQARTAVELQQSADDAGKEEIKRAFTLYKKVAHLNSGGKIDPDAEGAPTREQAHKAAAFALEYAAADDAHRIAMEAADKENQRVEVKLQAERKRLRGEAEKSKAELLAKTEEDHIAAEKTVEKLVNEKQQLETTLKTTQTALESKQKNEAEEQKQKKTADEQKKAAEEAEYKRRYSPDDTVYNLRPLSVIIADGITTIPAGSELNITGTNENGLLQLKCRKLETEVARSLVTHDRDLAAKLANSDASNQIMLRQQREKQLHELWLQEQKKAAEKPKPTPAPAPPVEQKRVNPLGDPSL